MSQFSRSRTRKFLYQKLYASCFEIVEKESFHDAFFSWVFGSDLDEAYLDQMFEIIQTHQPFFISLIERFAPKFSIETMDVSFVLPIFIALWEILYLPEEIPMKVSLNEAVEIAKVYGDDASKKMVNGVLNQIVSNFDELKELSKNHDTSHLTKQIFKK